MSRRVLIGVWIAGALYSVSFHAFRQLAQTQVTTEATHNLSERVDFQRDIQPIFEANCYGCHGPNTQLSGFRLDVKQAAMVGGTVGKNRDVVPGKAAESALYARVAGLGGVERMPMGG